MNETRYTHYLIKYRFINDFDNSENMCEQKNCLQICHLLKVFACTRCMIVLLHCFHRSIHKIFDL